MDRFKLMETFAAVVTAGSYTRAAAVLGVTSAMVSKRIQDLETELGVRLLNRNTHQLSVTDYGADYHATCVNLLGELQAFEERLQVRRKEPQGDLRILATRTFSDTLLAPIITAFCARYPAVSVQVVLMDRAMAPHATDLVSGGYDLAIRTLAIRDSSLVARPLIALPRRLVAAPAYLTARGVPRTPQMLAEHNCFDPANTSATFTWELHRSVGRTVVRVSGTPRTNSTQIVRHATLGGLGIGLLRNDLVADALAAGQLVPVLPDYSVKPKKFYVIYQKDRHPPLRMKVFVEFLRAEMHKSAFAE